MDSIGKIFSILIIITLALTTIGLVKPACVSIPKPSVPKFDLTYSDQSYTLAPAYTTDPYTGKTKMQYDNRLIENKNLTLSIKNQPFTPYKDTSGNEIYLFYNISSKGHFSDHWSYYPVFTASNTDFSILTFKIGGSNNDDSRAYLGEIPEGGQMDFRVEALIGYFTVITDPPSALDQFSHGVPLSHYYFHGESSGLSPTQTFTMPQTSTSTSNSPTPTIPEFPTSVLLPLLAAIPLIAIILLGKKKHSNTHFKAGMATSSSKLKNASTK